MSTTLLEPGAAPAPAGPPPMTQGRQSLGVIIALWAFVVVPFVALIAAIPVAWGWGLTWLDLAMAVVLYVIGGCGARTGFSPPPAPRPLQTQRWGHYLLPLARSHAAKRSPAPGGGAHRRPHPRAARWRG